MKWSNKGMELDSIGKIYIRNECVLVRSRRDGKDNVKK